MCRSHSLQNRGARPGQPLVIQLNDDMTSLESSGPAWEHSRRDLGRGKGRAQSTESLLVRQPVAERGVGVGARHVRPERPPLPDLDQLLVAHLPGGGPHAHHLVRQDPRDACTHSRLRVSIARLLRPVRATSVMPCTHSGLRALWRHPWRHLAATILGSLVPSLEQWAALSGGGAAGVA